MAKFYIIIIERLLPVLSPACLPAGLRTATVKN